MNFIHQFEDYNMKTFCNSITLVKNKRWIYDLDTFKWCDYWLKENPKWCYWVCYANKILKSKWFDFSKLVYRNFEDKKHLEKIWKKLEKINFVRIWVMCDPSSDWDHTLNIVDMIRPYIKNIVIITKHWTILKEEHLERLNWLYINTSISALDTDAQISHRLTQYNKLKKYCNSILRVNTADFTEQRYINLQNQLLDNENVIDNILRLPKNNKYVLNWLINLKKYNFLGSQQYASKHNENIFFWHCNDCKEKCWIWFYN